MLSLLSGCRFSVKNAPSKVSHLRLKSVLSFLFLVSSFLSASAQFTVDNNYRDINFGGTGVTISYFPSGSSGTKVGDIVLYRNVVTLQNQVIDCYIKVDEISAGTSISNFDQTASSGNGWDFNSPRLFSPFMIMPSGTATKDGGDVTFRFQFIRGGSFSYNNTTKQVSAVNMTLQNVRINVYDIDGNGALYTNQSARFGGFQTSELNNTTNLTATFNLATGLTSFRSKLSANTVNVKDDKNRVRVTYNSLSNFVIKISGGVTNYSFVDFGVGEPFTEPPIVNYQISGNVYNDSNGLLDGVVNGIKISKLENQDIYINVLDGLNQVLRSVLINSDGSYVVGAIPAGTYKLALSTYPVTLNSTFSQANYPSNWEPTGEKLGTSSGSDGVADGVLNSVVVSNANVSNANFGLNRQPEAKEFTFTIVTPQFNSLLVLGEKGTAKLEGNDLETGVLSSGSRMGITSLPDNGNKLVYNGVEIRFGLDGKTPPSESNPFIIASYDPAQFAILFSGLQTTSVQFTYTVYDNLSLRDQTSAAYVLNWSNPLPVEFLQVEAILNGDASVEIQWSTASELNNDRFLIQRMNDGETEFETIGETAGAGTSNETKEYSFIDDQNSWNSSRSYYRIKQIDFDGAYDYSEIVAVVKKRDYGLKVYPSPATTTLNVTVDYSENTVIRIADLTGALVFEGQFEGVIQIDVSEFTPGYYFLKVQLGTEIQTKKIEITK